MDVDGCLDYCDNMYLRTNFNTFFIKLSILVLIQLYDWSITIVVSILVFEFVLMFIWFCSCLFFFHDALVLFMFVFFMTPQVSFSAKYFSTCCATFVFVTGSVFV